VRSEDNALLYVIDGRIEVAGEEARRGDGLVLGAGAVVVRGDVGARFAFLRGRAHREPIVHRGPFVD
jgi:redox-sensitive bicupin YhaK (pirin superfamily)